MRTLTSSYSGGECQYPNLGLASKVKGCKVVGQEGGPGIMLHAPRSVKKCEGIDL